MCMYLIIYIFNSYGHICSIYIIFDTYINIISHFMGNTEELRLPEETAAMFPV